MFENTTFIRSVLKHFLYHKLQVFVVAGLAQRGKITKNPSCMLL